MSIMPPLGSPLELVLSFAIGLCVGLSSSFLGLGGGILIVPLLPLAADISTRGVIGTSLLTVFLVSVQNTWAFHRKRLIEWRPALVIGAFSSVGSFVAGRLTKVVPLHLLDTGFFILLLALGLHTLYKATRRPRPREASGMSGRGWPAMMLGFVSGIIAGFTGIGGGVFVVPVLSMYDWVAAAKVVPTSVATILLTSAAGAAAFLLRFVETSNPVSVSDLPRLDLAMALFLGGAFSSRFGQAYQSRLDPRKRDWLIGFLLLVLSIRILMQLLHAPLS